MPRYVLLLESLYNNVTKYNEIPRNTRPISPAVVEELTAAIKSTKEKSTLINEAQRANERKLLKDFLQGDESLIALFNHLKILVKGNIAPTISREFYQSITNNNISKEQIAALITKYRNCFSEGVPKTEEDEDTFVKIAEQIKTHMYYARLGKNNKQVSEIVKKYNINIHGRANHLDSIRAKLQGYASTTDYFIDCFNDTYKNGNQEQMKHYLGKLGLQEEALNQAIEEINKSREAQIKMAANSPPQSAVEAVVEIPDDNDDALDLCRNK